MRGRDRSVWNLQRRLDENYARLEELLAAPVDEASEAALRLRLAVLSELRRHLALAQGSRVAAARTEAVRQFQQTVLEALGRASPRLREAVVQELSAVGPSDGDEPPT